MSSDLFAGLSLNPSVSSSPTKTSAIATSATDSSNDDGHVPAKDTATAKATATDTASNGTAEKTRTTATATATASTATATATGSNSAPSSAPTPPPVPASAPPVRLTSAPATDRLLGLLGTPPSSPARTAPTATPAPAPAPTPPALSNHHMTTPANRDTAAAAKYTTPSTTTTTTTTETATTTSNKTKSAADEVLTAFSMESQGGGTGGTSPIKSRSGSGGGGSGSGSGGPPPIMPATPTKIKPSLRGVGRVTTSVPHADVAMRLFRKFAQKTQPQIPASHGGTQSRSLLGYLFGSPTVHDRKFDAYKSLMECVMGDGSEEDDAAAAAAAARDDEDPDVTRVLGISGDTMAKTQEAVARFCHLLNVWGHASAHMAEVESKTSAKYQTFCDILSSGLDTATALVTHGCLDGVRIQDATATVAATGGGDGDGNGNGGEPASSSSKFAVDVLAESVFSSDLSQERVELASMKFLLSTGCRVSSSNGQAMLHGSHLLQTIRVLYHVYLTTEAYANKTTARASLQQLVTSVFIRMIAASREVTPNGNGDQDQDDEPDFPTENHRDAFLVLRSLCKLSMRSPPSNMHSHVGLQAGNSNTTWDSANANANANANATHPKSPTGGDASGGTSLDHHHHPSTTNNKHETPSLIYTQAIHPALESKILALDLLLYVLQNTAMQEGDFLQYSGRQFHYAIRNYLCVSLLKNCTSDDTRVVNLSLRVFVPLIRNFRVILKTEIEAFVTNVFFVILDSKNSPMDHKSLVVTLFKEICSDPTTLAEIFLNYDCDLSAVDLFHRIVNTLAKVARSQGGGLDDLAASSSGTSTLSLVTGVGAARMEKMRSAHRELRLDAMRALRQVLASLHGSIIKPMPLTTTAAATATTGITTGEATTRTSTSTSTAKPKTASSSAAASVDNGSNGNKNISSNPNEAEPQQQNLVQIYGSKKKRREEESEVILRFNQKPSAGLAYAAKCGHVDGTDPTDVARYLIASKEKFDKTQIGEYLGREPDYQKGFCAQVLNGYVISMDFTELVFDDAIRYYLSGFRLPGEAQKIDRIMEKFAERFTAQNPDVFPTADVAFILAFSTIMLNTDLHNPAIKEERRMTKEGFIRNNRGICDGKDLPPEMLMGIFDRIQTNPISLKEDDEARERAAGEGGAVATSLPSALSPAAFFTSTYEEADRTKERDFNKERDQIVRTTESLLRRRRHSTIEQQGKSPRRARSNSHSSSRPQAVKYVRTEDSGLRDEYVSPMFEVTWGPALAAFSTAMESANGTVGALLAIATDEELEAAATNAAETIEVCLTGFRFAICTAGLCGNDVARDAFMLALKRFSQLGTGILLEPRHVRCIQTILALARADGELLGSSWEHVFRSLSEVNRFHQLFQLLARNDRVIAQAAARRRARLDERERRKQEREERRAAKDNSETLDDGSINSLGGTSEGELSYGDSDLFSQSSDMDFREDMNNIEIDEANARTVYEAVSEALIEAIYERSSSMSTGAVKEFVLQLCRVSRMEISHYGGQAVGSDANQVDLTQVQYRQHHSLLGDSDGYHPHQPNIYNLQKLVEVTHYNMDSRPRLVFADIWTPVSAHLTSTALHTNPAVAMYAVDSFRQLSIQYLQREELGVFEFQRRFLKPLEIVMAKSEVQTTKELLLKCVERLILMFGTPDDSKGRRGMLRSGWRPVLTVLGLAGREPDEEIAQMGFTMLTAQLEPVLSQEKASNRGETSVPGVLLDERFVDLVDALLIYVDGPHEEMSLKCIDHLLKLSAFLADDSVALPLMKKRASATTSIDAGDEDGEESTGNEELELWWPILLGISRAIGDDRKKVRLRSLEVLLKIITTHFLPSPGSIDEAKKDRQIQLLQLVFRGILIPVLENAEMEAQDGKPPQLPSGFDRFLTAPKRGEDESPTAARSYWLDTTFEQFMDACISICRRSIEAFGEAVLVEEILAMLNSCLVSDSGALAVRGLRRLEQFLSADLKSSLANDDTWATVSHMLRRSLFLRGLPKPLSTNISNDSDAAAQPQEEQNSDESSNPELEHKESIREFIMEDNMLPDRRFIGSNAILVIGTLLDGERFVKTLDLRWRLFLVSGVGKAISDWEYAASIVAEHGTKSKSSFHNPPSYLESALYSRKQMIRFLLQLASMKEVAETATEGSHQKVAQTLIKEQTESLITAFLEKEAIVMAEGKKSSVDVKVFDCLTSLLKDMLVGYDKLPEEHLQQMAWLNPVLSACIHTDNESIRLAIQKLVQRLHD